MSEPYRVEVDEEGCSGCEQGKTWCVIGPDETGSAKSYGDYEDAEYLMECCNTAFKLGPNTNRWTKFCAETPPPANARLMVWDSEFNMISVMHNFDPATALETAIKNKYTHWMLGNDFPRPPADELPAPLAPAPEPKIETPPSSDQPRFIQDYEDDIPF